MVKMIASMATYMLTGVLIIVLVCILVVEFNSSSHVTAVKTKDRQIKAVACDDLAVCQFQDHTGTEIFPPTGTLL
jgi:hypothetical protein